MRLRLEGMDVDGGMRYVIDQVGGWGTFDAQVSWVSAEDDPLSVVMRYEDVVADNQRFLTEMFGHLDVDMPANALEQIVDRFAFKRMTGGRDPGEVDPNSHYRKGVAGDWENHFTPSLAEYFRETTGDAPTALGYAW